MRFYTGGIAVLAILFGFSTTVHAATKYWVGDNPNPTPSGTWDTGSTPNWNDALDGLGNAVTWADFDTAVFSAGGGATGSFTVTNSGAKLIGNVLGDGIKFEEGNVTITGGSLDIFNTIDVASGLTGTINSSIIVGSAQSLNKTGTGTLVLNGDNSGITGTINVNAGTLVIPDNAPAGVVGDNDGSNGQTATATKNVVVANGATLEVQGIYNGGDSFLLRGDGVNGGGALRKTGANETVFLGNTKGVKLNGGSARITSADPNGTLTFRNGSFGRNTTTGPPILTFDGPGNIKTTAAADGGNWNIAISTSVVVKEGSGTLTLNGISSYTGGTIIKAGTVQIPGDGAAGSQPLGTYPAAFDVDNVIIDGGVLKSVSGTSTARFVEPNRGVQIGPNGGGWDFSPSNPATIISFFNGTVGEVTASDVTTLNKLGAGEIRMTGGLTQAFTFDKLDIKAGTWSLGTSTTTPGQDKQLGNVPASPLDDAIIMDGGNLRFLGGTPITLDVNRGITLNSSATGATAIGASTNLIEVINNSPATIPGKISGTGRLNKIGGNSLTLTGNNTYTGATTISGGKLLANNVTGSATGTGAVTIASTATLGGTGAVSGAVTINTGGNITPGDTSAIGKFGTGALSVGGTFIAELNSTLATNVGADLLNAAGNLSLTGSTLSLSDLAGVGTTALPSGTKFTLISYSGSWDNSTFTGLADDTGTIVAGANTFMINYNDTVAGANFGGGSFTNFVTLTTPASTAGDWNGDTKVNAADFVTWRKDPASFGNDPGGYVTWRENFQQTSASGPGLEGPAAVPEPASIALVMFGLGVFAMSRRTRVA